MRIIGGQRRGIRLQTPAGQNTRPTTDRARETLFNLLAHGRAAQQLNGRRVADLFAGTGAVGLEALSRGARQAVFVETDQSALSSLKINMEKCGFREQATLLNTDACNLPHATIACDLVFLDPPYGQGLTKKCLESLLRQGWLAPEGLVVAQLHPKDELMLPPGLSVVEARRTGTTQFMFLKRSNN